MKVEAADSSETSSLCNTLYDVAFQQTVAAVKRFAVSENRNANTACNGTNNLAVDTETPKKLGYMKEVRDAENYVTKLYT
jgi:hypothetical protein